MKQSKGVSFLKSVVSTAVGFAVAMAANAIVLPFFGWTPTLSENLVLTTIYTVISIARGYVMERAFEAMGWRTRMSAFALAVLAERQRQIQVEGWTTEHDDRHEPGELASASACYSMCAGVNADENKEPPSQWPWERAWWKPSGFRDDLIKAGALNLAEGERHDRNRKRKPELRPEINKGGHNDWPSQVTVRPGPPAPSNVTPLKTRSENAGSSL